MADAPAASPTGTELPRIGPGGPGLLLPVSKASGPDTAPIPSIPNERSTRVDVLTRGRVQNPVPLSDACRTQWVTDVRRAV